MKILKLLSAGLLICLTACSTGMQQIPGSTGSPTSSGGGLGDIIGGSGGSILENIIEGVFAQKEIEVADLAGQWTVEGSAVSFQSENFLAQAGGMAAAGTIENKLNPYFEKYGLTGTVFNIQADGKFTAQVKKLVLQGTITKGSDGNFVLNFTGGIMNLGKMTVYITKTAGSMDMLFDASKLKQIVDVLAHISGSGAANSAVSLLNNYEGIMVGVGLTKTGNATPSATTGTQSSGAEKLLDLLKR